MGGGGEIGESEMIQGFLDPRTSKLSISKPHDRIFSKNCPKAKSCFLSVLCSRFQSYSTFRGVERVENGSPNRTIEYFPKIVIKPNCASYQYCVVASSQSYSLERSTSNCREGRKRETRTVRLNIFQTESLAPRGLSLHEVSRSARSLAPRVPPSLRESLAPRVPPSLRESPGSLPPSFPGVPPSRGSGPPPPGGTPSLSSEARCFWKYPVGVPRGQGINSL